MKKEKDEDGNYTYLTVGELRRQIAQLPADMEVKIRTCHNPCGNIVDAGTADASTYSSFGASVPCVILEPAFSGYIVPKSVKSK
jgi:hypothetical protein